MKKLIKEAFAVCRVNRRAFLALSLLLMFQFAVKYWDGPPRSWVWVWKLNQEGRGLIAQALQSLPVGIAVTRRLQEQFDLLCYRIKRLAEWGTAGLLPGLAVWALVFFCSQKKGVTAKSWQLPAAFGATVLLSRASQGLVSLYFESYQQAYWFSDTVTFFLRLPDMSLLAGYMMAMLWMVSERHGGEMVWERFWRKAGAVCLATVPLHLALTLIKAGGGLLFSSVFYALAVPWLAAFLSEVYWDREVFEEEDLEAKYAEENRQAQREKGL